MKIGVDLRTLMNGGKSGIPGFTYNLLLNLLKEDTQNKYFGFFNAYKNTNLPDFHNIEIKSLGLPNKILNSSLRFLNYPKLDKLLGADVFYMPHFNFNSLSDKSYKIITVHDLSFIRYPEFFSFKNNAWHKMIEAKKTLKKFDKIIAVSKNTKADIIELFKIPEQKIEVIYSGIDDKYFILSKNSPKLQEVKNKYKLPEKFILSLGTIEPRKNIDSLIKAFDIFCEEKGCEQHLVIAGGLGWKYKNVLAEYQKAKHKDKIMFIGYIDEEDKNALYNLSDLFVFPSYYEGFGFPPLEAMRAGTPVISAGNSSMLEILDDSAYFIDPYDIADLSNGIKNISQNEEIRKNLIEKGQKTANSYTWEKCSLEYKLIFNNIKKK